MALQGKLIVITGASTGIGNALAQALASAGANLALISRSADKLSTLTSHLTKTHNIKATYKAIDITQYSQVQDAITSIAASHGPIDILINNAGLALGAPNAFHDLSIQQIDQMNGTNVSGMMYCTHAVLNSGMLTANSGTILNVTSTTALEVPPFPGEAVYHANKAAQEGFTNALRTELSDTNIRVLALRPGVVATNFHEQRVGYDKGMYDEFMEGFQPLVAQEVADAAVYMLSAPLNVSVKALDVVPSAQRSLSVFDREWNKRNGEQK